MSGFESIGLILGVWPLLLNSLQLYKTAKNGSDWDLIVDEFRTEEIIYEECVRHLLSDTSEVDLLELGNKDKPNQALWNDAGLHGRLHNRLGHEKASIVLKTLQDMEIILMRLHQKLKRQETAHVGILSSHPVTAPQLMFTERAVGLEISPRKSRSSSRQRESTQSTRSQWSTTEASHEQYELWIPSSRP
jgi:hypothetical protein